MTIYTKTATKAKSGTIYAFGRQTELDGCPVEQGGYVVFKMSENYCGHVRGGIRKSWGFVEKGMSYIDAVKLMNKRCGYEAFKGV